MRQWEPELSFSIDLPVSARSFTLKTFFYLVLERGCPLLRLVHSLKEESLLVGACRKGSLVEAIIRSASFIFS
jgi:hypothetical protein